VIVVSNSSPLIVLSAIDHLWLLKALYGRVLIPRAVYDEVVLDSSNRAGAREVSAADWIEVHEINNLEAVEALTAAAFGPGESEAIVLAREEGAAFIILDDLRARKIAERYAARVTGVVGVLILAKRQGLIPELRPILDLVISTFHFRIASTLYRDALRDAGEL
jgi:predicted nucleic acid-binding protein